MWYNNAIREYADYASKINQEYCRKYGFDIAISSNQCYQGRGLAWERVPLVLRLLESYDYVAYIDSDAFFYKDAISILDIIQACPQDKEFIFSNDYNPQQPTDINAGVFIVKSNAYSKLVMKEWMENPHLIQQNPYPDFQEQGVLRGMVMRNFMELANHCVIVPYGILQHFFEYELEPVVTKGIKLNTRPLVLHLAANPTEQRILKTKTYWETHFARKG